MALDVDPRTVRGRWVRHGPGRGPAWPDRDPPPDSRWQRGEVVDALYLADSEPTAWAEWYRHLAELGVPPDEQMPRRLWQWEVEVRVADLSTLPRLTRVGLAIPHPGRAGWPAYQAVGEQLWSEGWVGLIAPSAARRRGKTLCLFREAGAGVTGVRPVGRGRLFKRPPAPPTGMTT
ncbi:MAG: RES family NAD+ phosphorylase [Actinobacteria bacterium]|nr:RES family NAD+ phosphorylase [Actinomycetota bacterium]